MQPGCVRPGEWAVLAFPLPVIVTSATWEWCHAIAESIRRDLGSALEALLFAARESNGKVWLVARMNTVAVLECVADEHHRHRKEAEGREHVHNGTVSHPRGASGNVGQRCCGAGPG